jgi:hypothetical protein
MFKICSQTIGGRKKKCVHVAGVYGHVLHPSALAKPFTLCEWLWMLGSLSRQPQGVGSLPERGGARVGQGDVRVTEPSTPGGRVAARKGWGTSRPRALRYILHGSHPPGCPDLVLPAPQGRRVRALLLAPLSALHRPPSCTVQAQPGRRHRAVSLEEPPTHLSRDVPHLDIPGWTFDRLRAHRDAPYWN